MRLFIAAEIPADARGSLWEGVEPLRESFPRIRWVPPENLHVTLKFLGETRDDQLDLLVERIAGVARMHEPFEIGFQGIGGFPTGQRAKTIWVGLEDEPGSLSTLAAAIDDELVPDFDPEKRAYHPHVTVARASRPVGLLDAPAQVALPGGWVIVSSVALFCSHLDPGGARYERLEHFSLGSP